MCPFRVAQAPRAQDNDCGGVRPLAPTRAMMQNDAF
jgi:hypothetical protein